MRIFPHVLLLLLVTALGAFVLGRLSAPEPTDSVSRAAAAATAVALDDHPKPPAVLPRGADSEERRDALPTTSTADPVTTRARVVELEAQVARLRSALNVEGAVRAETDGHAVPFPAGRSAAQDERALHDAVAQALHARGLDGEVTALDCSEFPCIAHGVVRGVSSPSALDALGDDAVARVGWGSAYLSPSVFRDPKTGASKAVFSLAVMPNDLGTDDQQNLNKRLRARKNAYVDASPLD